MLRVKVGFACIVVLGLALAGCGPSGATPDASGEITIIQIDEEGGMRFEPGDIVLTAGQTVRIVLQNQGEKDHEFMIGQNVIRMEDGAPNGFETDFFEGIEDLVTVMLGEGAMLMIDDQMIMMDMEEDMDMEHDMEEDMDMEEDASMEEDMAMEEDMEHADEGEHDEGMGHAGWMVMDAAGSGPTVIEFVVPLDRVGEWEMGCFEDDGTHYEDGMRGKITVVEP
jgi:uncharacterized cupredoxin-like copper-binding protein